MSEEIKQKKNKKVKVVAEGEEIMKKEKKEKKDKKRKDRDGEAVSGDIQTEAVPETSTSTSAATGSEPVVEETKEERRARKKAKKEAKAAAAASESAPTETEPEVKEETKEERRARRKAEKLAKELATDTTTAAPVPAPSVPADEVALKKKSKQERKEAGASKWTQEASEASKAQQARAEQSPIYQDESLSDQAKKGLYYCELHAASQTGLQEPEYRWKFNKARQGWLMRNVWNEEEVPETYFDKVVGYLKTLPGSARKGMIETAKKHATAVVKPVKESSEEEVEAAVEGETEKEEEKEEKEAEEGSGGEASVEMRRDRAQRILKALGAR